MKGKIPKILSVALALVLALSFSLVTAVPAGAASSSYPGLQFQVQDKSDPAVGTASWVKDTHSGNYAVRLETGTPDALEQVDFACVVFPYNQTLSTITELGYSYKLIEGRPANDAAPYMVLELDTDEVEGADTWVVHHMFVTAAEDQWGTWLLSTDTLDPAWHAVGATTGDYTDWAAVKAVFDDDTILNIKVAVGEWLSDHLESHHVDDFQLNGVTYDLEPAVINTGTSEGFNNIQDAIYDAETLAGHTITVAAGTYAEEITVDENLTITCAATCTINGDVHFATSPITMTGATLGTDYEWYVDSDTASIQNAIDSATSGDTINVAAGTYDEQLKIGGARTNLTLIGDMGDTSAGPGAGAPTLQPTASPDPANGDVHIYSDGVAIKGFIFDFNGTEGARLGYGILVQAADVEIRDNEFQLALGGYGIDTAIGQDTGALVIDRNNFVGATTDTPATNGSAGVHINPGGTSATKTVSNNVFSGPLYGAVAFHSGLVNITDNVMTGEKATPGTGTFGVHIGSEATADITDITVSGNDISQFGTGIDVFEDTGTHALTVTIKNNIVQDNTEGIFARDKALLTVNYNSITGNTAGVLIEGSGTADAKYNYWGDPSGPTVTTNARGTGDTVTVTTVDYEPWLHTTQATVVADNTCYYAYNLVSLQQGWNIWSTPIAMDEQANTWKEYRELGVDLGLASDSNAYYFNGKTQSWANPGDDYVLTPCDALYIKMASAQETPILFSPTVSAPSKMLYPGWNLVSASYFSNLDDPDLATVAVEIALASVYYATGASNIGYSVVTSPAVNQTPWSCVRGETIGTVLTQYMVPTEGYWVHMVNGGTLVGAVFTPVSPLLP